jgi:hypothetical protein
MLSAWAQALLLLPGPTRIHLRPSHCRLHAEGNGAVVHAQCLYLCGLALPPPPPRSPSPPPLTCGSPSTRPSRPLAPPRPSWPEARSGALPPPPPPALSLNPALHTAPSTVSSREWRLAAAAATCRRVAAGAG